MLIADLFQNIERLRNHWTWCVWYTVLSSPTMMFLITSSVIQGTEGVITNAFSNSKQPSSCLYLNNLSPYKKVIFQTKYFLTICQNPKTINVIIIIDNYLWCFTKSCLIDPTTLLVFFNGSKVTSTSFFLLTVEIYDKEN